MHTVIKDVNDYVKSKLTLYATSFFTVFPNSSTEEIIIRKDPSNAKEVRYLDGSRNGVVNFSYYTKSKSQQTAEEQLYKIEQVLDLAELTEIARGCFVKIDIVNSSVFVDKTEINEYIFTSSFRLEYFNQK
jgi:hypothetical protein